MPPAESPAIYRFGDFELDVAAYELRRGAEPVRLERQPMDLLILLVQRRGELVTRAEIVDRLWGKDVFVDVETGVHTAVRKVRQALGDPAGTPAFLETVAGRGYRFVARVDVRSSAAALSSGAAALAVAADSSHRHDEAGTTAGATAPRHRRRVGLVVAALALAAATGGGAWVWLVGPTPVSHVTLAVLPFENLTGDTEREYLADGLTEEVIASFGQLDAERVRVIGRTSTMAYKNTRKSVAEIGQELAADYLVEGSVRAENARLRVTSTLIRVRGQAQVWTASYDREPSSMLALQRELSAAIAEQVRYRLSPDHLEALRRRHTQSAEAYDLYLRGLTFMSQRTPATTRLAIEHFERATVADPHYALAWSALAMAYSSSPVNSDAETARVRAPAREAAQHAIRAAPDLAEAQFAHGYVNWMLEWNWPVAESAFRRAVDLDRRYAQAHLTLGHLLSQTNRHNEAAPYMRRARELDPLSPLTHALSSQVAFQARDYPAAVEHARQAVVVGPDLWIGHVMMGQAYEATGQPTLADRAFVIAARLSGNNSKALSMRAHLLAKTGKRADAMDVLKTLDTASRERYVPPFAFALVHAGLGNRDAMFAWLDRAHAARDIHLMFLTVDSKWDPYRDDPRFAALLSRCNFGREQTSPLGQ